MLRALRFPKYLLLVPVFVFLSQTGEAKNPIRVHEVNAGAYGYSYELLTMGWGTSYRLNNEFCHQFSVTYSEYKSTCLYQHFKGYGATYIFFNDGNFSLGAHYFKALIRYSGHYLQPYWKIAPSWFHFEGRHGMNLKPAFGFRFCPMSRSPIGLELDVCYGYDVPIIAEHAFTAGRHDFSAVVALSINMGDLASLFCRDEESRVDAKF